MPLLLYRGATPARLTCATTVNNLEAFQLAAQERFSAGFREPVSPYPTSLHLSGAPTLSVIAYV